MKTPFTKREIIKSKIFPIKFVVEYVLILYIMSPSIGIIKPIIGTINPPHKVISKISSWIKKTGNNIT